MKNAFSKEGADLDSKTKAYMEKEFQDNRKAFDYAEEKERKRKLAMNMGKVR